MEEIPISTFKATCLAVLEEVRRTRRRVRVTRFGTPVAEIVPPSADARPASWLGGLAGTGRIQGDLIAPVGRAGDWDALGR
jgi:prevent-host-death family protein